MILKPVQKIIIPVVTVDDEHVTQMTGGDDNRKFSLHEDGLRLERDKVYYKVISQTAPTEVCVFKSGHRDQITCSLLGGFSKPRAEVIQSLDSGICSI